MTSGGQRSYNERVEVFVHESNEKLGAAHFNGQAGQNPHGLWSWEGRLTDLAFNVYRVWGIDELRLEFSDGASGIVLHPNIPMSSGPNPNRFIVVTGNGTPPRVE